MIGFGQNCYYSIELYDGVGDGWNAGGSPAQYHSLEVHINGILYNNYTMLSGSGPDTYYIPVNNGDTLETFPQNNGANYNDCGYVIKDIQGTMIRLDGLPPVLGNPPLGCNLDTSTHPAVFVEDSITAIVLIIDTIKCFGDFATIQVITQGGPGPYGYLLEYMMFNAWYTLSQHYTYDTTTFTTLPANNYRVTVTDTSGCATAFAFINIIEPPLLTASITQSGINLTVNINGGIPPYSYQWTTTETTQQITPTTNGTYWVLVEDILGCEDTTSFNVTWISTDILDFCNQKNKKIFKITNVLGESTKPKSNTPLFYIYDDGTVEKRITIE